jgi:tRNA nucleotidyltransferase (CCA-adding enzyme)
LAALQPERLWREMDLALAEEQPWRFFEVLHRCGALERLIPELARELGDAAAHQGGELPSPLSALRRAAALSPEPAARFAAVFQSAAGTDPAALCRRLRAEREPAELLELLVRWGADFRRAAVAGAPELLSLLERLRAWQRPRRWERFLTAAAAVWPAQGDAAARRLRRALAGAQQADAEALRDSGLQGAELGRALKQRRVTLIEEALAGERGEVHG